VRKLTVRRCKILLALLALENGEDVRNINFNIVRDDSLEVDWNALFPEVFSNGGFDVVIGNPPYVKFQDLQNSLRKKLYDNWLTLKKGNYNLYFAFFELGIKILRDDGILGYITPNNYFTSISGVYLREFLSQNKYIYKIVDFNHLKLFEAQTYTCVSFLNKQTKETFLYEKIQKEQLLKNLFHIEYSKIHFNSLNNRKWRLLRSKDQGNIRKIENAAIRLCDLVDIRVGIATCKDAIYFIDGNTLKDGYCQKRYNNRNYFIEKDVTRPIVKISDFKDQKALDNNKRRIIFPYNLVGSKMEIIPEDDFKEKHPQCYKYFVAVKEELSTRDKGKTEYPAWYAYARTQGLGFQGEKLLTPTFSSKPSAVSKKLV